MNYWEAILLGLVQGIAEFLPVSSSGHLVLVQTLLGHTLENLAVDVALHFGTLLSIVVVYFRELLGLFQKPRLMGAIILATIPLVFVGLFLKDTIEAAFGSPVVAGVGLCLTSAMLLTTLRFPPGTVDVDRISWKQSLLVGLFQCVAITPGVSRSGSTIVAGLLGGLRREAATQFSFLIAVPAILGATILQVKDLVEEPPVSIDWGPVLAGTVVAFVVGIFALRALIRVVAAGKLIWFAWYCLLMGVITITVCLSLPTLSGSR